MKKSMKKSLFNFLMIETTNICNLSCSFCASGRGSDSQRPKGAMTFNQFKNLINQIRNNVSEINILGYGEPFLTPDIAKMIKYLGKNNLKLITFTNGTILTPDIINAVKENKEIEISFSVDGISQKTYSQMRRGGNLRQVLQNISKLAKFKRQNKLNNLKLIWQFLVTRINEKEINKLSNVAKKIGVDILRLKTLNINKSDPDYKNLIPRNSDYHREKSNSLDVKRCSFISPGMPAITWQGDVKPCCFFFYRDKYMGNAFKENLFDIWNSKEYRIFRDNYLNGKNEICNNQCHLSKHKNIYIKEINFETLR